MTSIVKVSPARNIYEQVKWKCKTYSSMFSTVLILYILLTLLTGGGSGSLGMGRSFVSYKEQYYTLDALFMFTVLTMLIFGWMLASKSISRDNFSIVTTNNTEAISSALFLVVLSVFTLVSAISTLWISVMIDILRTGDLFIFHSMEYSLLTFISFTVSLLLAASIGYFIHALFDFSKIVFALLFAGMFLLIRQYTIELWEIIFGGSAGQLIGRSTIYIVLLWLLIVLIRQRREVSRT